MSAPESVDFSVWMSDLGCGQTILMRVLRYGSIVLAVMYRAPYSYSDEETVTVLVIVAMLWMELFHIG